MVSNVHKLRKASTNWDGSAGGLGFPELCLPQGFAFPLPSPPVSAVKGLILPKVDGLVRQLQIILYIHPQDSELQDGAEGSAWLVFVLFSSSIAQAVVCWPRRQALAACDSGRW